VAEALAPTPDPLDRIVERRDHHAALEGLRVSLSDPNEGVFGPDSWLWRMVRPMPVLPLALATAGLLEAPHPYIAVGTEGTKSATEFIPRFHRSFDSFLAWFCGDWDRAASASKRVFGYHSQIGGEIPETIGRYEEGHRYAANEMEALLWVWATIVWPIKEYYELFHGRLAPDEVDAYYVEARRFAELFAIDLGVVPPSWEAFTDYFFAYADSEAMDLRGEFLERKGPLSEGPTGTLGARLAMHWAFALVADVLPEKVRRQYPVLPLRLRERLVARVSFPLVRGLLALSPSELREWPRARAAMRRVGAIGATGPIGRWLDAKLPAPYDEASDRVPYA